MMKNWFNIARLFPLPWRERIGNVETARFLQSLGEGEIIQYPSPESVCRFTATVSPSPARGEGKQNAFGFTLAELLIALAILGVIATFTIPKILDSGSDSKFNSIAKEAVGFVSGAYQTYKLNNTVTASTTFDDLTPYLNYVAEDSVTLIDNHQGATSLTCSNVNANCLKLHNGAIISYSYLESFNDSELTNAIWFYLDPDGIYSGSATGAGKSVLFYIYYNGRVRTYETIEPNTMTSTNTYTPLAGADPPWFSWSK